MYDVSIIFYFYCPLLHHGHLCNTLFRSSCFLEEEEEEEGLIFWFYDEETENYLAISGDKNPRKRTKTVLKPNKVEYY